MDESPETHLNVVNQDGTGHAVVVEIGELADDPDPVYSAGRTVDAESDVELAPFEEAGEYEVTVTVDGESTTLTHTFENEDGHGETSIGIDNDGAVTIGSEGSP